MMLSLRRLSGYFRVPAKLLFLCKNTAYSTQFYHCLPNYQPIVEHFTTKKFLIPNHVHFNEFYGFRGFYSRAREENDNEFQSYNGKDGENYRGRLAMCGIAIRCPPHEVIPSLERWIQQGNVITPEKVRRTLELLAKLRFYKRGYDVTSWLWKKKPFRFDESYYASHLDFLFRATDMVTAEQYFKNMPSTMKGIEVHRSLLRNYVNVRNVRKAEDLFERMKKLRSKLYLKDYNSMLLLYSHTIKWKIPRLLKLMEESNVKPNILTYQILISAKISVNDNTGMMDLIHKMKAEGLTPSDDILVTVAMRYIRCGMIGKAEETLGEAERVCNSVNEFSPRRRHIIRNLLQPYALLNREKDVDRHWKEIESDVEIPIKDYMSGISAWGMLGNIDKAERIFERLLELNHRLSGFHYSALLEVYANHNLQSKAENLMEHMAKNGVKEDRMIRSLLVKLHVNMGDLQKAESMLSEDYDGTKLKPTYKSLLLVLQKYAEIGDIVITQKIFAATRKLGYKRDIPMYMALIKTHIKANIPAYGLKEEMMVDNLTLDAKMKDLIGKLNSLSRNATTDVSSRQVENHR